MQFQIFTNRIEETWPSRNFQYFIHFLLFKFPMDILKSVVCLKAVLKLLQTILPERERKLCLTEIVKFANVVENCKLLEKRIEERHLTPAINQLFRFTLLEKCCRKSSIVFKHSRFYNTEHSRVNVSLAARFTSALRDSRPRDGTFHATFHPPEAYSIRTRDIFYS